MQSNFHSLGLRRLEDLADQVHFHYTQGSPEMAEMLHKEALELASALDNGDNFLYINDLKTTR